LQGRLDHQIGADHQFFARYTHDDVEQWLPTDYPQFPRAFISTNQFATLEYRNVLSSRTFQTARFGYSRTRIGQNVEANLESPLPPFVAGRALVGDIDIGGMQRFGPQASANLRLAQNVYSGQYDLTHARGGHLFKGGAMVEHYRDFMTNPTFTLSRRSAVGVAMSVERSVSLTARTSVRGGCDRPSRPARRRRQPPPRVGRCGRAPGSPGPPIDRYRPPPA